MRLRDQLAECWAKGLTVGQIGADLGLTRGAVIGLISRARKSDDRFRPRLTAPKPPPKVRRLKLVDEAVGNRTPLPAPPEPPRSPPTPRLLINLDWHDCRWPVGQAADGRHLMCGLPQVPGRPYCARHCGAVRSESASA